MRKVLAMTTRRLGTLCVVVMLAWWTWGAGLAFAVEGQTRPSLPEMEKAFIEAVEADGNAFGALNYRIYEKPFSAEIYERRLGCMRSDASGNFDRGWTLADDVGTAKSMTLGGYHFSNRFMVLHGYRVHSADERAMWILDRQTKRIIPVLLHGFPWVHRYDERPAVGNSYNYVSAFLTPDMSVEMVSAIDPVIEDWLHNRINLAAI